MHLTPGLLIRTLLRQSQSILALFKQTKSRDWRPLKGVEQCGKPGLESSTGAERYERGDEKAWQMSVGAERGRERS